MLYLFQLKYSANVRLWRFRTSSRLMKSGLTIEKVVDVLNDKIQEFDGTVRAYDR